MRYKENLKKAVVIKLYSPGVVKADICRRLNISKSTAKYWCKKYKQELEPEIKKIWEEAEKKSIEKNEEDPVDVEKLLLEAAKREYQNDQEKNLPNLGEIIHSRKRVEKYNSCEKYVIINKVRSLGEFDRGIFLRQNGFKKQQIKIWEDELLTMSKSNIKNDEYIKKLEGENKKLRKNLKKSEQEKDELKVLIELKKKYPTLFKEDKDS